MREVKTMKLFKKTGAMLLCIIMAVTMILPLGVRAAEEGGGDPAKVLSQIRLSVGDGQETQVYKAGEKAELKINVINKGNVDAQDVTIIPVIKNAEDWPFDLDMLNNERDLGTVAAGSNQTAVWGSGDDKLTVRDDVTGKSYKLVFEITYNDGEKVYQTEKYVFVKTVAKEKPADQGGQGSQCNFQFPLLHLFFLRRPFIYYILTIPFLFLQGFYDILLKIMAVFSRPVFCCIAWYWLKLQAIQAGPLPPS